MSGRVKNDLLVSKSACGGLHVQVIIEGNDAGEEGNFDFLINKTSFSGYEDFLRKVRDGKE